MKRKFVSKDQYTFWCSLSNIALVLTGIVSWSVFGIVLASFLTPGLVVAGALLMHMLLMVMFIKIIDGFV